MINFSSFVDEFVKIAAMPGPKAMQKILADIGRASGKMGKSSVPKARPMTAVFRGGKMVKVPHGPPPIPAH